MKKNELKTKMKELKNNEYIKMNEMKNKVKANKLILFEGKRSFYLKEFKNLFTNNLAYAEMLFKLLELEHFVFIYKNAVMKDYLVGISKRPRYSKDTRTTEEFTLDLLTSTIDEALSIVDFRINNINLEFNPNATHSAKDVLNGEPDFILKGVYETIYIEQQTVTNRCENLVLKYAKFKKIKQAVANGKKVYLLTKYIDLDKNEVRYDLVNAEEFVGNEKHEYIHNKKEGDKYYNLWKAFGSKAIVKTEVNLKFNIERTCTGSFLFCSKVLNLYSCNI